jgi:hypothetical protein
MSTTFETCAVDGVRLAIYQNCAISVWNATTSDPHNAFAKHDELLEYLGRKYSDGAALLVIIAPGNPIPSSTERKQIDAFYKRWTPSLRAAAQVAEGNDLWSVTARSVMVATRLVQRSSYPTKVFSNVPEAVPWLAEYMTKEPGMSADQCARGLQRHVDEIRRMAL